LIPDAEGNVILPGSASRPNPPDGFSMMFVAFLYRGLSLPAHEYLRCLLVVYDVQLWQLTSNSILHLAILLPFAGLFLALTPIGVYGRKSFFVKRYNSSNGSFVTGGVGFVV
jgi:hypothetical protein